MEKEKFEIEILNRNKRNILVKDEIIIYREES
jgi:hypothetical protein